MFTRRFLAILLIAFLGMEGLLAQPVNPSPGPVGGIVYLLIAALGFGVYKLKDSGKKQK